MALIPIMILLQFVSFSSTEVLSDMPVDISKVINRGEAQLSELSPFLSELYMLSTLSGKFETMFDSAFSPSDVNSYYSDLANYCFYLYGVTGMDSLSSEIADTAEKLFSTTFSPLTYFTLATSYAEDYLKKEGVLNSENARFMAYKLFKEFEKIFKADHLTGNPGLSMRDRLTAIANYLKMLSNVTPENAEWMARRYLSNLKEVINEKN